MLLAVPIGIVVGISLGALGGGGSILTVPALVYLLGQSAHGATTASLVIVGTTALVGALVHGRAGRVQWSNGIVFGALGIAGSFVGSRLSAGISTDKLLIAFAALMLLAALAMLRRSRRVGRSRGLATHQSVSSAPSVRETAGSDDQQPAQAVETARGRGAVGAVRTGRDQHRWPKAVAAASVVGLMTGFFGVGGGFVVVPALVLALGLSMPVAVGTSLVVIAINSATALVSRIGTRTTIDWLVTGVFVVAAITGSLLGARAAARVRPEVLGAAFGVLLVALSFYTAARSLPHLA